MADPQPLEGLRRLVVHARRQLAATTQPLAHSGRAMYPPEVAAYAARMLASEVLQLVADCLPEEGGLVDAEIVGFEEQVVELEAQRAAALAIHKPCHTAATEPWICGRHSDPEHDGHYRLPAACMDCVDGDENAVPYPCPTAQALGVTTWLASLADVKAVATDG